jgi:hypothetical protein
MYAFCDEKVLEIMGVPGMVNSLGSSPHTGKLDHSSNGGQMSWLTTALKHI